MIICSLFPDTLCCDGCHEDIEHGFELIAIYDRDEVWRGEVCCFVWNKHFEPLSQEERFALIDDLVEQLRIEDESEHLAALRRDQI